MNESIELISGDLDDPVVARDSKGITYHFGHDGEIGLERARLLEVANRIADQKERISAP